MAKHKCIVTNQLLHHIILDMGKPSTERKYYGIWKYKHFLPWFLFRMWEEMMPVSWHKILGTKKKKDEILDIVKIE